MAVLISSVAKALVAGLLTSAILVACAPGSGGGGGGMPPDAKAGAEPPVISGGAETCEQFIAKLPADFFYDWITVPENYLDPDHSPTIRVFYYGPRGNFQSHVVFFNGGPGADSHYNSTNFDKAFTKLQLPKDKVGFVYIDQRGNGCSSPYPTKKQDSDLLRDRFYGSTGIVYDAEAVRKHLYGTAKWKVFGQSYGAFVVHRYTALFPNSISDAYAHANTINADPIDRLAGRLYSQYDVMEKYLTTYPDDRARLKAIRTYLIGQPNLCLTNPTGGRYCGTEISENLISHLGFSDKWIGVHKRLGLTVAISSEVGSVDNASLQHIVDFYTTPRTLQPADHSAATTVIGIYDRNVSSLDFNDCTSAFARIETTYHVKADDFLLSECASAIQFKTPETHWHYVEAYLKANSTPPTDHLAMSDFIKGLKILGPTHFYLYSGERDMFVPKENFTEELAATKGLLTYQHFPNSGHEGFYTELQVLTDLLK